MKRLLFIVHRVPYPPDKGERVRAFHELKALAQRYCVTVVSPGDGRADYESAKVLHQWCERVILSPAGGTKGLVRGLWRLLRGGSATEGYFHSDQLSQRIRKLTRDTRFDVAMASSSAMLGYLLDAKVPHRVLDMIDVDSAKWFTYAAQARWPKSWIYQREGRAVQRLEQDSIIKCDAVLVVSEAEAHVLGDYRQKVGPLCNGVDMEFFSPREVEQQGGASVVFTGTMDYRPNVDGVCWFVEKVWPGLKQEVPELRFVIVGRNPTAAVRGLSKHDGVEVTGAVDDVRGYLAEAGVAVCPLRIARGLQNKVLEAMAMGKAVVSSGPALEGLEVEIGRDVLQADTPEQWHESLVNVLRDDQLRTTLGKNARSCVEQRYNWDTRMAPLVSLCESFSDGAAAEREADSSSEEKSSGKMGGDGRRRGRGRRSSKDRAKEADRESKAAAVSNVVVPGGIALSVQADEKPVSKWLMLGLWAMTAAYATIVFCASLMASGQSLPLLGSLSFSPLVQNMLHMPAYALLMLCVSLSMSVTMRKGWLSVILSVLICFGIGLLLEYLQGLVAGRTSSSEDVMLNTTGIMLGLPAALTWRARTFAR